MLVRWGVVVHHGTSQQRPTQFMTDCRGVAVGACFTVSQPWRVLVSAEGTMGGKRGSEAGAQAVQQEDPLHSVYCLEDSVRAFNK